MNSLQKQGLINKYFSILNKWKNSFFLLPLKIIPAYVRLNYIGSAFRESRLIYLAVKLDIADLLDELAVPVDLLAEKSEVNVDNLYRILRALVSMGIFKETQPKIFANNRISLLLRRTHKYNLRQHFLNENSGSKSDLWFNQFETRLHMATDDLSSSIQPCHSARFENDSLWQELSGKVNTFQGFDWSTFDFVFDLGNANGEHVIDMLVSSKDLNICIYDNPAAVRSAKILWLGEHTQYTNIRLSFEPGNIFKSLPNASSPHNLYCFVRVFSGLSDKDCLTILNNIKLAMATFDATVAIVDTVLPIVGLDTSDAFDDIELLLENSGKHRTLEQWQTLIAQTDFNLDEMVDLRSSNKILVLRNS
jgi:hypothetical protein